MFLPMGKRKGEGWGAKAKAHGQQCSDSPKIQN